MKESRTFENWCKENDHDDYLIAWSEANNFKPSEISFGSKKKCSFHCLRGLHKDRQIVIDSLVRRNTRYLCKECNSLAQWGIDTYGEDFLEKYWGKSNIIDPYSIQKSSGVKVYIKCQKNQEHGEYLILCSSFYRSYPNSGCPMCTVRGKNGKPSKSDSLGTKIPDVLNFWSDINNNTPYDYTVKSHQIVYWKCDNNIHDDYSRCISETVRYNFRCPICSALQKTSMLENKVSQYFEEYGYTVKHEYQCDILPPTLTGYRNQKLPYDNEIVELKLIVEVNGKQHYVANSWHLLTAERNGTTMEYEFLKQQERDRYKKQYALDNGYFYLEIPYSAEDNDQYKQLIDDKISSILHTKSVTITA